MSLKLSHHFTLSLEAMLFTFIRLSKEFYFIKKVYRNVKLYNIHFDLVSHTLENPRYSRSNLISQNA